MGFGTRGNRIYYYKKEREGGRVVSRYMGGGSNARLFAELDRMDAEEKDYKLHEEQQRRKEAEKFEALLSEIEETTETVEYFKTQKDLKFICLERGLDTTKKWNLANCLGEKFKAF
jgi:hypothetical protein